MACCCKSGRSNKSSASCLGRCDLPKHKCLDKRDVKPGPVPKHMGWHYTAKDAPEHQLRCGWRPGHISCQVLKKIEQHNCMKAGECAPCSSNCLRPPCCKPCSSPPKCVAVCPSTISCCKTPQPCSLIRIIRHGGQYTICTKPSNVSNAPSGPYPLKYVLNTETDDAPSSNAKYSVEAKFNDYHFDYTSSQTSFVLDFSPPEQRCYKPCPKKSIICMACSVENNWPCKQKKIEKIHKNNKSKKLFRSATRKPCTPSCIKPCCRPYPPTCIKPCYNPFSITCLKSCDKPCPSTCIKPCYKPYPCRRLCYNPSPCIKRCYKLYPCRKPIYKPCPSTCINPCCKPYPCRKPCPSTCINPFPSTCIKPCPSTFIRPCPSTCIKPCPSTCINPCCNSCSIENTVICSVCSTDSICPVKKRKKKKRKPCKCKT